MSVCKNMPGFGRSRLAGDLGSRIASKLAPAGLTICTCLATSILPAQTTPTFTNVSVHDPSIVRDGSTFYIFGSHLASASTTDLMHWTQLSTDPVVGNPIFPNPPVDLADAVAWVGGSYGYWAPDVIKLGDGHDYFYYCVGRLDQPRAALGLAVSDTITGPYSDLGVMLRSGPGGQPAEAGSVYDPTIHPNTIDPAVFYDQTGRLWMVYGSYSGGIFILELDPASGMPKPGQGYGKHLMGGNHARIEGSYILYSPESEYYYFFVSYGGLDAAGGYNIRLGRSRNPDGPYLDAEGTDLATVKGAPGTLFDDASIAPHGVKLMGGYQFLHVTGEPAATTTGYLSPGHNSAYYDAATDRYFLVHHTRFVGRGEVHEVRVHQMFVNADDWLVVAPFRFAGETIAPTDVVQIPGNYKLINHGKSINPTAIPSTNITLQPDGTITGAQTGTWQLSLDYDATIMLGGVVYRGVFVRQWDDDNQRWVLTFTALSGDGTAIWGSKVAIAVAPVILTPPAPQTVAAGTTATLSVALTADPVPTYQWHRDGVDLPGGTGRELVIDPVGPDNAGSYTVTITNEAGSITSAAAILTVTAPPPFIGEHPTSITQPAGTTASLTVVASGSGALSYQWLKNDVAIPGATSSTLAFASLHTGDAGNYLVRVTDDYGTTTSRLARIVVATPVAGRIVNMSVRSTAGVDGNPLIVGFVMVGGAKDVLVRGIGPALAAYDVTGFMTNPALEMHGKVNDADTILGTNDNWGDGGGAATLAAEFDRLGAFPLPDANSRDAALLTTVGGLRTVHAKSATPGASGIVLVEAYDAGDGNSPRLVNVSARNHAGQGFETLIAGFVISGNAPTRVLIRGVGPTLADFDVTGVLADPHLEVHTLINNLDRTIAVNDDWANEPGAADASAAASAFPLRNASTDAAIVMTLPAGSYTALVSGADGSTGEALVEVYELGPP